MTAGPIVERRENGAVTFALEAEAEYFTPVVAAADSRLSEMRRAFLRDAKAMRANVDLADLTKAIENVNVDAAVELLVPADAGLPRTRAVWVDTFEAGGKAAARELSAQLRNQRVAASVTPMLARTAIKFDVTNPAAVEFAKKESAKRVTQILESTREAIREALARAFTEAHAPRELARELIDLDLGLSAPRQAAVESFEARLTEEGVDADAIERRVEKYAEAQLRERALDIARTETIEASARGQDELWDQASRAGLIDAETAEEEWIVTPDDRLCDICEPMDRQRVKLGAQFTLPTGDKVDGPGAHPKCRCAKGLVL